MKEKNYLQIFFLGFKDDVNEMEYRTSMNLKFHIQNSCYGKMNIRKFEFVFVLSNQNFVINIRIWTNLTLPSTLIS